MRVEPPLSETDTSLDEAIEALVKYTEAPEDNFIHDIDNVITNLHKSIAKARSVRQKELKDDS